MNKPKKIVVAIPGGVTFVIPGVKRPEIRAEALVTLSWILRCFEGKIEESYKHGSPRLLEAYSICRRVLTDVRDNSTEEEYYQFSKGFSKPSRPAEDTNEE